MAENNDLLRYAMEYANSTNAIENNGLTEEEIMKIHEDIASGKKDESFLYSIIEYMERKKQQQQKPEQEEKNVLQR